MTDQDLSDFSMLDLFRMEVEAQAEILNNNLLALETQSHTLEALASSMRAAHSIKGAARIVQVEPAVKVAHVMEDCFFAAQEGRITLSSDQIDILLRGVDLLVHIAQVPLANLENWLLAQQAEAEALVTAISAIFEQDQQNPSNSLEEQAADSFSSLAKQHVSLGDLKSVATPQELVQAESLAAQSSWQNGTDRGVRVSRENLNRLMGLAGESLVEANWLLPFADSLQKLKRHQNSLSEDLEKLYVWLADLPLNQRIESQMDATRQKANECHQLIAERLSELEIFARRYANLSDRLYREVIATQMRPFADGVEGFPRMVRDLARQLDKQVKFEILGKSTQVDRDILEKLEVPLIQILRNAIDHGIESPQERLSVGKPAEGTVQLEAVHQAGMLSITVADDGRGVDLEQLRQKIVNQGMVSAEIADQLTETELMDFLFLRGFSTASAVTEISGRGVGLDIVQTTIQQVGGNLKAITQLGKGTKFHLQLPLTLSVIRALLVEISKEAYAFPLTRIDRLSMISPSDIAMTENRQFFTIAQQNFGLIAADQVLELAPYSLPSELEALPVVTISDRSKHYGVVVERFLGVQDLVVRPLDPRLGKLQDISAAALSSDGSIVLIVDVDDLVRSIDQLLAGEHLNKVGQTAALASSKQPKHILIVDDSITVREVEKKLLQNHGYQVEVAVNGMDAWNAVRTGQYDLVITDIDMPRMNGIELVSQIKNHPKLKSLPVIIVSYKDRDEDYIRGLEVGANYYLTKSSFHDNTLLNAVTDLLGN